MPRRPDFSKHQPDPRVDQYRNRVGRLYREAVEFGSLLVTTEPFSIATGGHLWWGRWGCTHDIVWLWTVIDGELSDHVLHQDAIDAELVACDQGHFTYYGEALRVEWLTPEESTVMRAQVFER